MAKRRNAKRKRPSNSRFRMDPKVRNTLFLLAAIVVSLSIHSLYKEHILDRFWPSPAQPEAPLIKPEPVPEKPKPALPVPPLHKKREIIKSEPKVIFVIDDIGHTRDHEALFRKLKDKITYA